MREFVRVSLKSSTSFSISIVFRVIPKLSDSLIASSKESLELYLEGIATPITFSAPNASTQIAAVKAESIPPEIPINTFVNLFFFT